MFDGEDEKKPREKMSRKATNAWIEEKTGDGDEDVLDLLSKKANQKILSSNPFKRESASSERQTNLFKTSRDGKLIIEELEPKKGMKRKRDDDGHDDDGDDDDYEEEEEEKETRDRDEDGEEMPVDDNGEEESVPKYRHGGQGIHRIPVKRRRDPRPQSEVKTGKEYKATKAGGDMKRKGKPDPYAYVPLNPQSLNKRKRAKLSGQFKNIIKAAKRGAESGANKRERQERRKRK
jgi:ribosomal RNA-processing protein 12